jgi:hypothetical protein
MVKEHCRKKCLGCRQWFIPNPRTQGRQRFCSKPACKKASKKWRQARWRVKPENKNYWRGSDEVNRVRKWRKLHLKRKHVVNPPDQWIRAEGVFEGIVETEIYLRAREMILARSQKLTDEEMLEQLRVLLKQHGRISGILIDEAEGLPSSAAFRHRFGALVNAYRLIGYDPGIDFGFIEENRRLRKQHPEIVASLVEQITALGGSAVWDKATQLLNVNDGLRVSIVLCRHTTTDAGSSRWLIRLDAGLKPDITIAVRMNATNEGVRDYYLLPGLDMTWEDLRVAEANGVYLDTYRFDTLEYLFSLTERINLEETT